MGAEQPILYIFGGLPGTGKTTLAQRLAALTNAAYLRVDTIEQAIREAGGAIAGPEGYAVAYWVAGDNLRIGRNVVADTVNPWPMTRAAWRGAAADAGARSAEIEVVCSDLSEHRRRIETRVADIPGLALPTWEDVLRRDYRPWNGARIVVDTAGHGADQSLAFLLRALELDPAS